jgi:SpoIID/LytB domain protein
MPSARALVVASLAVAALTAAPARADETSASDKLRILYSSRFTFTDDGVPLVTVEIVSHLKTAHLTARGGLIVRPDGNGGSAVEADGGEAWTITVERPAPAQLQEWTVVETLGADDATGAAAALARWKQRGLEVRAFELGTVFGVDGEVIDTREVRIAVDPVAAGKGAARAAELGRRYGLATSVHQELVKRPGGTIVARSGATTVRNPSVLWFVPRDRAETITVADVPTNAGGSQLETGKEDRRYWGSVYATLDHDGQLVIANAVSEDKLLAGLVPAEMYGDAPDEALAAQAIAARTELLQKIGRRNLTDPFLLCSSQQCQVYAGAGKEQPRATRAVERTRGVVLLRDGGGLVDIRYSASCGGHGEDNDVIWGGDPDPSLRGHRDAVKPPRGDAPITGATVGAFLAEDPQDSWCGRSKLGKGRFRWSTTLTSADLDARVAAELPEVGHVTALEPGKRGASGRIQQLILVGSRGKAEVTGDLRIRRLLGGLKSTLFEVQPSPGGFTFHGAGFGHGVGMCQMGAIGMADAGKDHQAILGNYYRGTHLHRLY